MKSDIPAQLFTTSLFALLLIAPNLVEAQTPLQTQAVVKQVFSERGRVVAETTLTDLTVNDEMVITLENGKQCALPILEIRGNILTLDSENCRYGFDIKPGLALEKSLLSASVAASTEQKAPQAPLEKEPEPLKQQHAEPEKVASRKTKFVVGAAFSGRTSSSGTGGTATGLSGTFTSELEYKEGFSISLEMRDSPANSWGYGIGITYDSTRELDSATFSSGGTTLILTSTGGASKIGSTSFEVNAIYRWNEFYIPLGLNYTSIRFTPATGYTDGYDAEGGFGAQLGFGVHLRDDISLEMMSRAAPYSLRTNQSGSTANYGNLMYSIVTFGIKGHF